MPPEEGAPPQSGNEQPSNDLFSAGDVDLDSALRDTFKNAGADVDQNTSPIEETQGDEKARGEDGKFVAKTGEQKKAGDEDGRFVDPNKAKPPAEEGKVPPVDPKKAKAAPVPPKTDAKDPEAIKPPAKLSKEGQEGWGALKEVAKHNHALVQQKEAKIQELQKIIASKSETSAAEVKKLQDELTELRGFRAQLDYQFDPEFKKQFGAPMEKLESGLRKMLTSLGVKDDVMRTLKFTDENQMARVAKSLEENVNAITADRFRSRVRDYIDLSERKAEFLEDFRVNHEKFRTQREQELQQKQVESQSVQLKHVNEIVQQKDEQGRYKIPFLLKYEPDPDATPEQVKAIEAHNAQADEYRKTLDRVMATVDPKERAEAAVAAVAAKFLSVQLREAQRQNAELQEQLKKYNKVSTEKGGGSEARPPTRIDSDMTADQAVEAAFPNLR